tara:strand:+ start:598 stop:759 length:162 start_codon:yes stop_codon:yes gene_type:complete
MNSKPLNEQPVQAVNDVPELTLEVEELEQLARFLDALMEADFINKSDGVNSHD